MVNSQDNDTLPGRLMLRIKDWLQEDGWSVFDAEAGGLIWCLVGEEAGHTVRVFMKPGRADEVVLESIIDIDESSRSELARMCQDDQLDVFLDLVMELTGREFEMSAIGPPIETIAIRKSVYFDGLSKDIFMRRANSIKLGRAFDQAFIQKRLRPRPAKRD